jgi:hypothetical protein
MMEEWDLNPRNGVHPKTSKEGNFLFFFSGRTWRCKRQLIVERWDVYIDHQQWWKQASRLETETKRGQVAHF